MRNPYLARAFADFGALWAGGDFADWTQRLLQPLDDALGAPPRVKADAEGPTA
jgi:exodeoxyribonuclease V gamma subunit